MTSRSTSSRSATSWNTYRDPLAVLRAAVRKLKPSGFIVTSLPNVAHGDVRLSLLHGSFQYRDTGLLDRTHMRFFTLQTIRELLHDAGLVVVDTRRVVVPLFHTELGVRREDYPEAVVAEIQADTEFETYQFVMKSVIDNGSTAVVSMAKRLEKPTDRVQELEVSNRLLDDRATGYAEMKEGIRAPGRAGSHVRRSHPGSHRAGCRAARGDGRRGESSRGSREDHCVHQRRTGRKPARPRRRRWLAPTASAPRRKRAGSTTRSEIPGLSGSPLGCGDSVPPFEGAVRHSDDASRSQSADPLDDFHIQQGFVNANPEGLG